MIPPNNYELFDKSDYGMINRIDNDHGFGIKYIPDTKVSNSGTFIIPNEDHTFGSIVKAQLLKDSDVLFSGYKVCDGNEIHQGIELAIQTSSKNPISVLELSLIHI